VTNRFQFFAFKFNLRRYSMVAHFRMDAEGKLWFLWQGRTFAGFQGTSNGGQRVSNLRP
jgi:hypothetical protein